MLVFSPEDDHLLLWSKAVYNIFVNVRPDTMCDTFTHCLWSGIKCKTFDVHSFPLLSNQCYKDTH